MLAEENTDAVSIQSLYYLVVGCKTRSPRGGHLCRVAPATGREDVLIGRWRRAGQPRGFSRPAKRAAKNPFQAMVGKRS